MSQSNRFAVFTNIAAGRAWMPSLFNTTSSRSWASALLIFFALIYNNFSLNDILRQTFYKRRLFDICAMSRSFNSLAGLCPEDFNLV